MNKYLVLIFLNIGFFILKGNDYNLSKQIQQNPLILTNVNVLPNNENLKKSIFNILDLQIGKNIDISEINIGNMIHKLWETNHFDDIKIGYNILDNNKVELNFSVIKKKYIEDVEIDMKGKKYNELINILNKNNLIKGNYFNNNMIKKTKKDIIVFYNKKGIYNTLVDIEEIPISDNKLKLKVNLKGGNKYKINNIIFNGVTHYSHKELEQIFIGKNWLISNLIGIKYTEDYLNKCIFKIKEKYLSAGFRDVYINNKVNYLPNNKVSLEINIKEGIRYKLGKINFIGNNIYTDKELMNIIGSKKYVYYDYNFFNKIINSNNDNTLASLYMDNGYIFFKSDLIERKNNEYIDVDIKINEGHKVKIDNVTISGNSEVRDNVIFRELRTKPGSTFSRKDINRTIYNLSVLPYIDATKLEPEIIPISEDKVGINWKISHKSSSQVELQGGYGQGKFVGTLGLNFGNFSMSNLFKFKEWAPYPMGEGQSLSLRAKIGSGYKDYSFSFLEPWLYSYPISLSTSFNLSNYSGLIKKNKVNNEKYKFEVLGANIGISNLLKWPDDYFRIKNSFNFTRYNFNNYAIDIDGKKYKSGVLNNINYNLNLTRDTYGPDNFFPTNGSEFSLNYITTLPYSVFNKKYYSSLNGLKRYKWLEYYKLKGKFYYYRPIIDKLILKMGGEIGYVGSYSHYKPPSTHTIFLGLSGNDNKIEGRDIVPIRGYKPASLNGGLKGELTPYGGGHFYNKFLMELRYPISIINSVKMYGLTFFEGGLVAKKDNKLKFSDIKKSAGFGIRFFMPGLGLLGFDLAYGFDKPLKSNVISGWNSHLIIGQQL